MFNFRAKRFFPILCLLLKSQPTAKPISLEAGSLWEGLIFAAVCYTLSFSWKKWREKSQGNFDYAEELKEKNYVSLWSAFGYT